MNNLSNFNNFKICINKAFNPNSNFFNITYENTLLQLKCLGYSKLYNNNVKTNKVTDLAFLIKQEVSNNGISGLKEFFCNAHPLNSVLLGTRFTSSNLYDAGNIAIVDNKLAIEFNTSLIEGSNRHEPEITFHSINLEGINNVRDQLIELKKTVRFQYQEHDLIHLDLPRNVNDLTDHYRALYRRVPANRDSDLSEFSERTDEELEKEYLSLLEFKSMAYNILYGRYIDIDPISNGPVEYLDDVHMGYAPFCTKSFSYRLLNYIIRQLNN